MDVILADRLVFSTKEKEKEKDEKISSFDLNENCGEKKAFDGDDLYYHCSTCRGDLQWI